jgi:hypothetical protein
MMKVFKVLTYCFAGLGLLAVLGSAAWALLNFAPRDVLARWTQPAGIPYDGRGPYHIIVTGRENDDVHTIYVGREKETPGYGHMVTLMVYPKTSKSMREFWAHAVVDWSPEGVRLSLPSGHVLFIPQKMFAGGR